MTNRCRRVEDGLEIDAHGFSVLKFDIYGNICTCEEELDCCCEPRDYRTAAQLRKSLATKRRIQAMWDSLSAEEQAKYVGRDLEPISLVWFNQKVNEE